ncbi:MAG: glycosyltransferase [Patescibacteria group bacterium]
MISIIIPSVNDPVLQKTIDDIRQKAVGEIEIIVVADGVDFNITGAKVIKNDVRLGLRETVNRGVENSTGEYILKIDEHCMVGERFDTKLLENIEDNWIVIPRRYELDVLKWEIMDEPPIDYERLFIDNPEKIGGVYWTKRRLGRTDIMVDETMVFQGSCYFMSRKHWDWLGGLQKEGYGPFAQEAIELALKTWLGGGKVMVNKNTWYAHKYRKFGRVVAPTRRDVNRGNKYSQDFWINNRWDKRIHDLKWLFDRFGLKYNPYKI